VSPGQRLLRAVGETRRRALLLGLTRAALAGAAGALASVLLLGLPLRALPEGWRVAGAGAAAALGALAAGLLAWREWRRAEPRLRPAQAAALLAPESPALRDLVLTGADLAAWGEGGAAARGASPELADAQVEEASRAAQGLDPAAAVPARPALLRALQAGGVAALVVLWLALDPAGRGAWSTLLAGGVPAPVTVGNLRLTYVPPAYTGLPEQTVEGAEGAVQGYPGTRVTLEGELSRSVARGRWEGPGEAAVPLAVEGRRFSVSWILAKPGTYGLAFEHGRKAVPSDFAPRSISLTEDARPGVELAAPAGDLEVTTDQEVEVVFAATDDFGVERAELVLQGDEEVRLPLAVTPGRRAEGKLRFLPLSHPKLGEGAHLRVEVWDGDTVSGPKAGSSPSVYITFLDKRRLLAEIAGLEERLLEALLTQLADHLELASPPAPEELGRLRAKGQDLLRLFDQLVERVQMGAEEGALGAVAVLKMEDGLRAALEPFLAGGTDRQPLVAELERDILFLDRLLQSLRMEDALSLGDELAALQRSLFDDLQQGANPEDLVARVEQIQQLLAQMAQKLSQGAAEMPDAFANADAVKDMPASELEQTLQELKEALAQGDREKAQALAEKLLETLSKWLAALEEAAGGASQGEMDPVLQELSELEADVQDLAAQQEKVLQETREVGQEVSQRAAAALRQELESLLEREERRLRAIEEAARRMEASAPRAGFHGTSRPSGERPPGPESALQLLESRQRVGAAVAEVREALREDLGRAREGAEALGQAVENLRQGVQGGLDPQDPRAQLVEESAGTARREVEGLIQDLEALAGRRREGMRPGEAQALEQLGGREGQLGERTGSVAERLEGLSRKSPFVDPGLPGRARSAQQGMGQAQGRLGEADPFGSVPPETRALEDLAELGRQLESARQQMGQGQQSGPGMQVMRRPGQRPGQRPGEGRDVDRSPVEIPQEMEARELRAFREEVLRAMQGRYPKDYEEEVERYYERLIR